MKRLLASTAVLAALALPSAAQQATTDTNTVANTQDAVGGQTGTQTGMAAGNEYLRTQGDPMEIRASEFIGMRVYRSDSALQPGYQQAEADWDDLGEINDVILTREGEVEAVLVDIGGFLGMGENTVAVNMDQIRMVSDDSTAEDLGDFFLVMSAPREAFDEAQAYGDPRLTGDQQGLGGTTDSATMQNDPNAMPDTATGTTAGGLRDTAAVDQARDLTGTQANVSPETTRMPFEREGYGPAVDTDLTAERLTGAPVYDTNDVWIGDVGELLLTNEGRVQAVVVDVGGFLGIGEKPVALELQHIDILRSDDNSDIRVYVPMTEAEMEAMPDYEG